MEFTALNRTETREISGGSDKTLVSGLSSTTSGDSLLKLENSFKNGFRQIDYSLTIGKGIDLYFGELSI